MPTRRKPRQQPDPQREALGDYLPTDVDKSCEHRSRARNHEESGARGRIHTERIYFSSVYILVVDEIATGKG